MCLRFVSSLQHGAKVGSEVRNFLPRRAHQDDRIRFVGEIVVKVAGRGSLDSDGIHSHFLFFIAVLYSHLQREGDTAGQGAAAVAAEDQRRVRKGCGGMGGGGGAPVLRIRDRTHCLRLASTEKVWRALEPETSNA